MPLGIGLGPFGKALPVAGQAFLAVLIVDDVDFGIVGFDSKLAIRAANDGFLIYYRLIFDGIQRQLKS